MNDFEGKLDQILNDPQTMSQIITFAQSLGAPSQQHPKETQDTASSPQYGESTPLDSKLLSGIAALFGQYQSGTDDRVVLLNALRPFLKKERYPKLDQVVQIAKLSGIARLALELFRAKEDVDV